MRPDGELRWLHMRGRRDASGDEIGYFGVVRDVTERHRTEAALASQVPHARGDAQGDEHDARLVELRTSLVRHPGPRRLPLARQDR